MITNKLFLTIQSKTLLDYFIQLKWFMDLCFLPLTKKHKELYKTIHRLYWQELRSFPNLIFCPDYNSKIQWLKLFDQQFTIVECTDKISVRDFAKRQLGRDISPELISIYDNVNDFRNHNFQIDSVIKTNHDSGTVFFAKKNSDPSKYLNDLENALNKVYGVLNGEWAYSLVTPKILVEEQLLFIEDKPPPDYKFHCVNGEVAWVQYIYDRGYATKEVILSREGSILNIHFDEHLIHTSDFSKPANWDSLVSTAEKISKPFRYVRVDLYNIQNEPYLGELTFFPLMGCYRGKGQKILGKRMKFSRKIFMDPIT